MSENAAGIPRYYVGWHKQATRIGDIDLKLMAGTLTQRSEHADELVRVAPGLASKATDAYEQFRETGDWAL